MRRRSLLSVLTTATVTGLAGCLSELRSEPSSIHNDTTPTRTSEVSLESSVEGTTTSLAPTSAIKTVAGHRISVANVVSRKAVAYESIMGSGGVIAKPNTQYIIATVRSGTDSSSDAVGPPPYDAFDIVTKNKTFPAVNIEGVTKGAVTTSLAGRGDIRYDAPEAQYMTDGRSGWVVFELPSPLIGESPVIRCRYKGETATWPLSEETILALRQPAPTFELRSFTSSPSGDKAVELSLTVENITDVGGEFLAAIYWPTSITDDDESHLIRKSVSPNSRFTWSKTMSTTYATKSENTVIATVEGAVSGTTTVSLPGVTTDNSR